MAEADYIIDDEGNLIVDEEGDKIITHGIPPSEVDIVQRRSYLGLSLGLSIGRRNTI